jgi:cobalt-zinc-cadmium efflux system outer membrane protein
LRARLSVLDATEDRLVREAVPKLGYNVGLDAAPASPVFAFVGMSVELPVAQKNQGPRAVAQAQHDTERARLELLSRRIGREVAAAVRSYAGRRARVELLRNETLPAARRTQSLVEEGWLAGRFDVFRLNAATRDVLRLEQEFVEAALSAWSDYIEVQRLSGALSP